MRYLAAVSIVLNSAFLASLLYGTFTGDKLEARAVAEPYPADTVLLMFVLLASSIAIGLWALKMDAEQ